MHQAPFVEQISPISIQRGDDNTRKLEDYEVSSLRSLLGALLYSTMTRPDLCAGICLVASKICEATVAQLRAINAVLAQAQRNPSHGLVYQYLPEPHMIMSISDSSYSTSSTSYAVEGTLTCLTTRKDICFQNGTPPSKTLNGHVHILAHGSHKASRISHSTSHTESLACYSASTLSEQLAARLTELRCPMVRPPPVEVSIHREYFSTSPYDLPIVTFIDCFDLLELLTGAKGIPQDRTQRLIILSLRERRFTGKAASTIHIRTDVMPANSLTKLCSSAQVDKLLSTGRLDFNEQNITVRPATAQQDYTEADLISYRHTLPTPSPTPSPTTATT
jgi:hypothetical protein